MILTAIGESAAIRFVPSWLVETENPPTFLLRAGSVLERELMEADLAADQRAGPVWPWELREAMTGGLRALAGPDADALIALVAQEGAGEPVSEEDAAMLVAACETLAEHWPPYRKLRAQMERRAVLLPLVAFRRFCCGWEGVDVSFSRTADRLVSPAAMGSVDPMVLRAAGVRAYGLQYGTGEEKNSEPPSPSDEVAVTSSSDDGSKADGS